MTTIETRDGQPVVFEHAVEMAEYLCALDFGLDRRAKEERATPQSVADLFCTYTEQAFQEEKNAPKQEENAL